VRLGGATAAGRPVPLAEGPDDEARRKEERAMIRKLILSAVIATGALTGLTVTPTTAETAPFDRGPDFHRRQFEVLVECGHRWENRGTFRDRRDAERAARRLRHEGFRVAIREC
jgi:hypothetical protein